MRVDSQVLDDLNLYTGSEIELTAVDIFVPDKLGRQYACFPHVLGVAEHFIELVGVIYPVNYFSIHFNASVLLAGRTEKIVCDLR